MSEQQTELKGDAHAIVAAAEKSVEESKAQEKDTTAPTDPGEEQVQPESPEDKPGEDENGPAEEENGAEESVEEEPVKSYEELVAEALRPLLNKGNPEGSYRVAVKGGVDIYLTLLEDPEFLPIWEEKVTQGKTGEELEDAFKELLAGSRIVLPEVKAKGDEIVKVAKPKGVWLKGLIATALADHMLKEQESVGVGEVQQEVSEAVEEGDADAGDVQEEALSEEEVEELAKEGSEAA